MLEELIAELRKHDRAEISYKSGVSLGTINHLLSGACKGTVAWVQHGAKRWIG